MTVGQGTDRTSNYSAFTTETKDPLRGNLGKMHLESLDSLSVDHRKAEEEEEEPQQTAAAPMLKSFLTDAQAQESEGQQLFTQEQNKHLEELKKLQDELKEKLQQTERLIESQSVAAKSSVKDSSCKPGVKK